MYKLSKLCLFLNLTLIQAQTQILPEQIPARKVLIVVKDNKGKKIEIILSQVLQAFIPKIQQRLAQDKKPLTPKEIENTLEQAKQELIENASNYLANQEELLKDPEFMQSMIAYGSMLARNIKIAKYAANVTDAEITNTYHTLMKELEAPKLFKVKVAAFDQENKAKSALSSLEKGSPFETIHGASLKLYNNGDLKDADKSFISKYSPNVPETLRTMLISRDKAGILPLLTIRAQDGKTQYWVVQILNIKNGTKDDLPKLDLNNKQARDALAQRTASDKVSKELVKSAKSMNVVMIDDKPAATA